MSTITNKLDKKTIIKWIITAIITFCVWLIPVSETYTQVIHNYMTITVFCILLIAFEFFDMLVPAVALPLLYMLFNVSSGAVILNAWTGTTIYMMLGAFVLANIMNDCGLLSRIAYFIIKFFKGSYNAILYGLMLVGWIISFLTFTNGFVIMATLLLGVCKALGYDKACKESSIIFMVGLFTNLTVQVWQYFPALVAMMEAGVHTVLPDYSVAWYFQMLYLWPLAIFSVLFIWILTKIYHTKDIQLAGDREYFDREYQKLGKMSSAEIKVAIIFVLILVFLLTTNIHNLSANYAFLIFPFLLYFPGLNVGTSEAIKKVNFSVLFFVAACMGIGTVGLDVGMGDAISSVVTPLLSGKGTFVTVWFVMFIGMIANLFMTPFAMISCLAAPLTQIAIDMGIDPLVNLLSLLLSVDLMFLPYEGTSVLVLFGFGMISLKDFVKFSTWKIVLYYIFAAVVLIPYWKLLGLC